MTSSFNCRLFFLGIDALASTTLNMKHISEPHHNWCCEHLWMLSNLLMPILCTINLSFYDAFLEMCMHNFWFLASSKVFPSSFQCTDIYLFDEYTFSLAFTHPLWDCVPAKRRDIWDSGVGRGINLETEVCITRTWLSYLSHALVCLHCCVFRK